MSACTSTMNVYEGIGRRQVGGSIWSTIRRGAKPFLKSLIRKLKPHAMNLGKKLAKKGLDSAMRVGTNLAINSTPKTFKGDLISNLKNEANQWKTDAIGKVNDLKRKIIDSQDGSGNKRRRVQITKQKRTHSKMSRSKSRQKRAPSKMSRSKSRSKVRRKSRKRTSKKVYKHRRRTNRKTKVKSGKRKVSIANKRKVSKGRITRRRKRKTFRQQRDIFG